MADSFAQFFSSIPDPEERLRALQKLVECLGHDERLRALQELVERLGYDERQAACALIQSRNDIFVRMPVDIILELFGHLRLEDTWTLQLVNNKWHETLSKECLRAALARWDTHEPSDSARSRDTVAEEPIDHKIRRMQIIKDDKPFTLTTFDNTWTGHQQPQPQLSHRRLDLKGDKIAYISSQPEEGDCIIVRNLVTGADSTLRGEARERIISTVITTKAVAFITFEGCLYIAEFGEHLFLQSTTRIQLPSSHVKAMGGHEGTLAIAMGGGGTESASVTSLLLYDVRTQQLRDFSVDTAQKALENESKKLNSCGIIVDGSREVVDLFTLACNPDDPPADGSESEHDDEYVLITHLRMSFSGAVVTDGTWTVGTGLLSHNSDIRWIMVPPQPTGVRNEYRISIGMLSPLGVLPAALVAEVAFHSKNGKFFVRDNHMKRDVITIQYISDSLKMARARVPPAEWKGFTLFPSLALSDRDMGWRESLAMVNDTFLVSLEVAVDNAQKTRVQVYCYDEQVETHAARPFI